MRYKIRYRRESVRKRDRERETSVCLVPPDITNYAHSAVSS